MLIKIQLVNYPSYEQHLIQALVQKKLKQLGYDSFNELHPKQEDSLTDGKRRYINIGGINQSEQLKVFQALTTFAVSIDNVKFMEEGND